MSLKVSQHLLRERTKSKNLIMLHILDSKQSNQVKKLRKVNEFATQPIYSSPDLNYSIYVNIFSTQSF